MYIRSLTLAAFVTGFVAPAMAETMVEDADANGTYSIDELTATYPELTPEVFASIDVDSDGEVSPDELTAAQEAGLIAS